MSHPLWLLPPYKLDCPLPTFPCSHSFPPPRETTPLIPPASPCFYHCSSPSQYLAWPVVWTVGLSPEGQVPWTLWGVSSCPGELTCTALEITQKSLKTWVQDKRGSGGSHQQSSSLKSTLVGIPSGGNGELGSIISGWEERGTLGC